MMERGLRSAAQMFLPAAVSWGRHFSDGGSSTPPETTGDGVGGPPPPLPPTSGVGANRSPESDHPTESAGANPTQTGQPLSGWSHAAAAPDRAMPFPPSRLAAALPPSAHEVNCAGVRRLGEWRRKGWHRPSSSVSWSQCVCAPLRKMSTATGLRDSGGEPQSGLCHSRF